MAGPLGDGGLTVSTGPEGPVVEITGPLPVALVELELGVAAALLALNPAELNSVLYLALSSDNSRLIVIIDLPCKSGLD